MRINQLVTASFYVHLRFDIIEIERVDLKGTKKCTIREEMDKNESKERENEELKTKKDENVRREKRHKKKKRKYHLDHWPYPLAFSVR